MKKKTGYEYAKRSASLSRVQEQTIVIHTACRYIHQKHIEEMTEMTDQIDWKGKTRIGNLFASESIIPSARKAL